MSNVREGRVTVRVEVGGEPDGAASARTEVSLLTGGMEAASGRAGSGDAVELALEQPHLWSPDDPFLYDLEVRLTRDGITLDAVRGEIGIREVTVGPDVEGRTRLLLNGEPVFQTGTLDQGWWPDGLYTAPTEEALVHDLRMTQAMGFNLLRKHVKVEPRIFYSWCDRLGLLVWQDMPSASIPLSGPESDTAVDPEATRQFETELAAMIRSLRNHPSIVMWVPFNEGWGQYDSDRIASLVHDLDPTRPVNQASGWHDHGGGDVVDRHHYPAPEPPRPEAARAAVQGEFGGLGYNVEGHTWRETGWGYDLFPDVETLSATYESFMSTIREAAERGLSASVYTQITDVETENNGLLTYDRAVSKMDTAWVRKANRGLLPPVADLPAPIFVERATVTLHSPAGARPGAVMRFTLDGSAPDGESPAYAAPLELTETTEIRARSWWPDGSTSRATTVPVERVAPTPASPPEGDSAPGLAVDVFDHEGSWTALPDFDTLTATERIVAPTVTHEVEGRAENYGLRLTGWLEVPETGVYGFHLASDDGSRLKIAALVVDNDGIHGMRERVGWAALEAGLHPFEIVFFQGAGGVGLRLRMEGPGLPLQDLPAARLYHARPGTDGS
jgi:hypothetical protein